jgi:hypothetical protein
MVDLVFKFKICEVLKCSECVYGYRTTIQGKEKIGCKVMDSIVTVPQIAKAMEEISKMNWAEMAKKLVAMSAGGKKVDENDKPG